MTLKYFLIYKMANLVLLASVSFLIKLLINTSVKGEIPCSIAPSQSSVIDVCSSGTVTEDEHYSNILLRSTKKMDCKCKLSIPNTRSSSTTLIFRKYNNSDSSSPGKYGCGVILNFEFEETILWSAQCIFTGIRVSIPTEGFVSIKSLEVGGTLGNGKGYCVEIVKENNSDPDALLQMTCGWTETRTFPSIAEADTFLTITDYETSFLTTDTRKSSLKMKETRASSITTANTYLSTYFSNTNTHTSVTEPSSSSRTYVPVGITTGIIVAIILVIVLFNVRQRCWTKTKAIVNSNAVPIYADLMETDGNNHYKTLQLDCRIRNEECSRNNTDDLHLNEIHHNLSYLNKSKEMSDSVASDLFTINKKMNIDYANTRFNSEVEIQTHHYTNEIANTSCTYYEISDKPKKVPM